MLDTQLFTVFYTNTTFSTYASSFYPPFFAVNVTWTATKRARHHGVTKGPGGHFMILTSKQHRGLAKLLLQKAAMKDRATRMMQFADVHMGLARMQDNNPALAPKPRSDPNQHTPSPSFAPSPPGENGVL
jgi:hypothetical protein